MNVDMWDGMAIVGLALLGSALWLIVGWPGVMAYAGVLMVVAGVTGARARTRRQ